MNTVETIEGIDSKTVEVSNDAYDLDTYSNDHRHDVRLAVAKNVNTSRETLTALANMEEAINEIHVAIASHSNTDSETLRSLYERSCGSKVKNFLKFLISPYEGIAMNKDKKDVLIALGHHLDTPVDVLEKLARFKVSAVRMHSTYNPHLPKEVKEDVLCRLIAEQNYGPVSLMIALQAMDHPELPENVRFNALNLYLARGYAKEWNRVARFKHLTHSAVLKLWKEDNKEIRQCLLSNPSLNKESYNFLFRETDADGREELRLNEGSASLFTPAETEKGAVIIDDTRHFMEKRKGGWFKRG